MSLRRDAEDAGGRIGVAEVRADPRLRGLFAAIDGTRSQPVAIDGDGALIGERTLADGVVFLPELNPADVAPRADRIGAVIRGLMLTLYVAMAVCVAALYSYHHVERQLNWPVFVLDAVFLGSLTPLAWREFGRVQMRLRDPRAPRPGNPGLFLLGDSLIVRRGGVCDVFPRQAIVSIAEVERTRAGASSRAAAMRYPISQITYEGPRGRCTYTLDVGPTAGVVQTPDVAAAERVRVARLRRLQAWLNV